MARKILLADDSVTAQNMGRKILADAGYDVSTVNNGSAALKRITELKPDLIVLDVYMPGYSGLEVCQRLKDSEETAHIPVLLTVGKLEPFKPEEARRVRADAHIVKPFEASELLTAITRLEDRMVPQSDGRFSTSVSGVERFGGDGGGKKTAGEGDTDTGWKSRLRFPSKKKKEEKEEPEPEDIGGATFRDFRKGKGKSGSRDTITVKAPPPPGQEPGLVPDIPRDITPEELDVLSALAAKLDAPVPTADSIMPAPVPASAPAPASSVSEVVQSAQDESAQDEAAAAKTAEAKAKLEVPAAAAPVSVSAAEVQAEIAGEKKTEVETPAAVIAEAKGQVEIPVEHIEPATPNAAAIAETVIIQSSVSQSSVESSKVESKVEESSSAAIQASEIPTAIVVPTVNTALLAQEAAPIDKTDEPIFDSAKAVAEVAQEKTEAKSVEAVVAAVEKTELSAPAEIAVVKDLESKPESKSEEPKLESQEPKVVEAKTESAAQAVAETAKTTESEEPAPSDAELAEALRLLTPATGGAESAFSQSPFSQSVIPSHGTLVAAGQLLAEEAARNAAAGPRWIAEPVALSAEEAALSLELEAQMFGTFATAPTGTSKAVLGSELDSVGITGVSAIAAAVENRLAEAGLGASSADSASTRGSNSAVTEVSAVASASGPVTSEPVAAQMDEKKSDEKKIEATQSVVAQGEAQKTAAEARESALQVSQETPVEDVAVATFADAVGKNDVEVKAEEKAEPAGSTSAEATATTSSSAAAYAGASAETAAAGGEENQNSSLDAGGEDDMAKDGKGKSTWHQIRNAPASAPAGTNLVEAAKAEQAAEAPKAMAAAAAADGSGAGAGSDASTIASIVDSVMADLRPRIVEEIAKKLAGK